MKDVEMSVEGETLIIKWDLSKDLGQSKSGKALIVASTQGNVSVPGRKEKIGLNIYPYPDRAFLAVLTERDRGHIHDQSRPLR